MLIADAAAHAAPSEPEELSAALTHALMNGVGGPMTSEERELWIRGLAADMQDIPQDLAIEAVRQARRVCRRAGEFLPFIVEYVGDYPFRRRRRLQRLIALADAAGVVVE